MYIPKVSDIEAAHDEASNYYPDGRIPLMDFMVILGSQTQKDHSKYAAFTTLQEGLCKDKITAYKCIFNTASNINSMAKTPILTLAQLLQARQQFIDHINKLQRDAKSK